MKSEWDLENCERKGREFWQSRIVKYLRYIEKLESQGMKDEGRGGAATRTKPRELAWMLLRAVIAKLGNLNYMS